MDGWMGGRERRVRLTGDRLYTSFGVRGMEGIRFCDGLVCFVSVLGWGRDY